MTYPDRRIQLPAQAFLSPIRALLADPQFVYIHADTAANGCFAARIERS